MEQKTVLTVSGLVKRFGVLEVLKGIDLTAQRGEVVSIIGPSGTGKSTLLRCINFLEKPTPSLYRLNIFLISSYLISDGALASLYR